MQVDVDYICKVPDYIIAIVKEWDKGDAKDSDRIKQLIKDSVDNKDCAIGQDFVAETVSTVYHGYFDVVLVHPIGDENGPKAYIVIKTQDS